MTCAVGCRIAAQSSAGTLVRHLGIDSDPVNQSWLCDKGRYGFEAVYAKSRLTEPLVRQGGDLVAASWYEVVGEVARRVGKSIERGGPESVGFIGGARFSNEDSVHVGEARQIFVGTDSVDAQVGDGLPAEAVLGLPHATIDDADPRPGRRHDLR